jgi:post-segregation antitoxin (ccd killing protein)
MHNRFDQLGKRIGQAALGRSGPTVVHDEISSDAQHADLRHEPHPARAAERARLGLLGRLASVPCLIEIYGHAPDAAEFRACLSKHLTSWRQRARGARPRKPQQRRRTARPSAAAAPFLWIIAAGTPKRLVAELELAPAPGWPAGVYLFGGSVLRVGLVAANELPRDRRTLLVRLMAAGPLLPRAIEELGELPDDAYEHTVAGPTLLALQHVLESKPRRTRQEQEVLVRINEFYEQTRSQWVKEGRALERSTTRAADLLTVLRVRGIRVARAARERILTETDAKRLKRWLERAARAETLAEVFGDKR